MSIGSIISNYTTPFMSPEINTGKVLATVLSIGAITTLMIRKLRSSCPSYSHLSDEQFWNKVETTPTLDVANIGLSIFSDRPKAQKEMALSCNKMSNYVRKYLVKSGFKGKVLDLGCGTGINAFPLVEKKCDVTVVDKLQEAIVALHAREMTLVFANMFNINEVNRANFIIGDLTTVPFPQEMDAVICVDTLPYLSPSQIKSTLQKIFDALRPGGQFIGTLFFETGQKDNLHEKGMKNLGAHFYPDKPFAREVITRIGFQIKSESERRDSGFFSRCFCLEFQAIKPA